MIGNPGKNDVPFLLRDPIGDVSRARSSLFWNGLNITLWEHLLQLLRKGPRFVLEWGGMAIATPEKHQ
jgi:hypothetical protein